MFLKILVKIISSEMTKRLIGYAIKKLLEHKSDGITKDVINTFIDGAVASKSNSLTIKDVYTLKRAIN